MDQLVDIVFSVSFVGIAVVVAGLMLVFNKLGKYLWGLKKEWLRKVLKAVHRVVPVLPAMFGAGLGAIPLWPAPDPVAQLTNTHQIWAMIILGMVAGSFWERVWKTFKSQLEARGIDIDLDETPRDQTGKKPED